MSRWVVFYNNQKIGPFTDQKLKEWLARTNNADKKVQVLDNETNKWLTSDKIEFSEHEMETLKTDYTELDTDTLVEDQKSVSDIESFDDDAFSSELSAENKFEETLITFDRVELPSQLKEEISEDHLEFESSDVSENSEISDYNSSQSPMAIYNKSNVIISPWRRFFASMFDSALLFPIGITMDLLYVNLFLQLLILAVVLIVLETFLIARFSTTPGKYLLSLKVLKEDATRYSLTESFNRAIYKWIRGYGLNIPIVSFISIWVSYSTYDALGRNTWDKKNNGYVIAERMTTLKVFLFSTILIVLIFFNVIAAAGVNEIINNDYSF